MEEWVRVFNVRRERVQHCVGRMVLGPKKEIKKREARRCQHGEKPFASRYI